jgi:Mrp family chromosome partitioning ATPase
MLVPAQDEPHVAQTLTQMAMVLVQRDAGNVLLADANLPRKTLSHCFEVHDRPGLAEACRAEQDGNDFLVPGAHPNLSILPGGNHPLPPMISPGTVAQLVDQWKARFQVVLVNGGDPESPLTKALVETCDSVYLLVRLGRTGRKEAQTTVSRLRSIGGRLEGCIVTDAPAVAAKAS